MMTNTAKHTMTHSAPNAQYQAAFQRLEQTAACWRAVADLLILEPDLHVVDRADFAELIRFLSRDDAVSSREDSYTGRLEELRSCWHAVADLLRPDDSLVDVDKDQFGVLCFRLAREQGEALHELKVAVAKDDIERATAVAQHVTGRGRAQS